MNILKKYRLLKKKEMYLKIIKEAEEKDLTFVSEEKIDELERTKKMYLQKINEIDNQLKPFSGVEPVKKFMTSETPPINLTKMLNKNESSDISLSSQGLIESDKQEKKEIENAIQFKNTISASEKNFSFPSSSQ